MITITANPDIVRVSFAGHVIALTIRALDLHEDGRPPVTYIPRTDVDWDLFTPGDHVTRCPHKGDARHYHVTCGGRTGVNIAWSHETPPDDFAAIAGHIAFYPDRVDSITCTPRELRGGSFA